MALALAMALLAAPAAALSGCWTSPDEARHGGCSAGCPMMAMVRTQPPSDTVQAVTSGNCCVLSSGKPAPTTQLLVPIDSTRTLVTPSQASLLVAAPLVAPRADSPGLSPPASPSSPQAVLCTFLI